ncbi:MAG: hypothetical protein S4CHLAM45_12430 [Chlamydiales bacterium]|nr:hypothetical protein [Chlamydiales bacterium]MCH9619732.1 hypothetical protein [Chlamydiales bacterium]MCH9623338.1 hypothetical protein [Chlamydiales bacterium]
MASTQDTWKKESGFIWSMIGSAVGFANILSFSALCYRNGGGAFLIPYIIAHLLVGLPMLFLEGTIGQKTKMPLVSALGNVAGSKGKLLGWLSVLSCATIGGFYIVLTGFAVAFSYFAAKGSSLISSNYFFKDVFLHDSGSLSTVGGVAIGVLLSTLLVAAFTWIVLSRNIRSGVERLCTFFLPLLGVLVVFFSIAALFLPGSLEGVKNYLIPDFSRLSNWMLWRDVFGQVFFSLSLGLGIVTGYSRHNPESFNIKKSMFKVALGDFLISFISGLAIFGCLGFMSHTTGRPFSELIRSDSAFEIGFVIFPTILAQFGEVAARVIGPIFFFCIFIAGVTGVFSIVESVAGSVEVEFNKSRKTAVAISMGMVTLFALPFCLGNGQHIVDALAPMVLGNAFLIGGIAEILFFLVLSNVICEEGIWWKNVRHSYSYHCLKFFVLPLLTLTLIGALYQEVQTGFSLAEIVRWSWLGGALLFSAALSRRTAPVAQLQQN